MTKTICRLISPKLVLVGGNPKGNSEPFSRETHSGNILHSILDELRVKPILIDIYADARAERLDIIEPKTIETLKTLSGFCQLFSLGKIFQTALIKRGIQTAYLPHPARHSVLLRERLRVATLGETPCECMKCRCITWLGCTMECNDGCCKESFPT